MDKENEGKIGNAKANPNSRMLQLKYQKARQGQLPGGRSAAVNRILKKLREEGAPKPDKKEEEDEELGIFDSF